MSFGPLSRTLIVTSSIAVCFDGFQRRSGLGTRCGVLENASSDDMPFHLPFERSAGQRRNNVKMRDVERVQGGRVAVRRPGRRARPLILRASRRALTQFVGGKLRIGLEVPG